MKQRQNTLAAHSYFHIINKAEQKRNFLDDDNYVPQFSYRDYFDVSVVQGHLDRVTQETVRQSLQLVLTSINLQQANPDKATKDKFRELNESLFGTPKPKYTQAILARIAGSVTPKTATLWDYVMQNVDFSDNNAPTVNPDKMTFQKYHDYFLQYYPGMSLSKGSLVEKLESTIISTGLADDGWTVYAADDASHARIDHGLKQVAVGLHYQPRTSKSAERIVVHEVYGHALRGPQTDIAESEGIAVLLEQLLDSRFKYRRAYRYLAGALGWGEAGGPRTFREVYEIIWRLMVIASRYSEKNAKSYAFDECTRLFRGGRPDIAGMVFLKDTIYFSANVAIWAKLEKEPLAYNEFVDIIEGRRKVLS